MTKQRKFYVPPEDEKLLEELIEILKRENRSLSAWVRQQAKPYVDLHRPGNPQQRLDTIAAIGHAYRAGGCCVCAKPAEIDAFTEKGEVLKYCRECYEKTGRRATTGFREIKKKRNSGFEPIC